KSGQDAPSACYVSVKSLFGTRGGALNQEPAVRAGAGAPVGEHVDGRAREPEAEPTLGEWLGRPVRLGEREAVVEQSRLGAVGVEPQLELEPPAGRHRIGVANDVAEHLGQTGLEAQPPLAARRRRSDLLGGRPEA